MPRHSDALLRLCSLKERNALDAERREAMRGRFAALAKQPTPTIAVSEGLFITPTAWADRMVQEASLEDGMTICEPSAGTGRILDAIAATGLQLAVTACEICTTLCKHLFDKYQTATLRQGDFLSMTFSQQFDRIIMNPPFRRGTDVKHINHALRWLKPGGKLVSLCYNGEAQRKHLRPIAATWEALPAHSFKESGTLADVCMMTVRT